MKSQIAMKSQNEVALATDKLNKKLSANPLKVWFEHLTNFPSDAKNISFNISRDSKRNGFNVQIIQDGDGTTLETINNNRLDISQVDGIEIKEKSKDTSSIYGTGLSTIGFYTEDLLIKVKTKKDLHWSVWNTVTNEVSFESLEMASGFISEMFIPFQRAFKSNYQFIQNLRDIISIYDARNISNGRIYKIKVEGMDTPTENKILSEVIQPNLIEWCDITGKPQNGPDVDKLEFGGKTYDSLKFSAIGVDDTDRKITLTNFRLGKRIGNKGYPNYISDIPMLNVYYKESQQLAFTLPLRGSSGLVSLNGVVLETDISKDELRYFFESTDKFVGINSSLKDVFVKELRYYLLSQYPDNNLAELCMQAYFYDFLVNDVLGKVSSNATRDMYDLSFLNTMSVKEREKVVFREWSDAEGRLDFKIYLVNETNGIITPNTPYAIVETKRKDFNVSDRRQAITYMVSTPNCKRIIAISLNISQTSYDAWNKLTSKISASGQLSFQPKFDIIDLADIGYNSMIKIYQNKILLQQKS